MLKCRAVNIRFLTLSSMNMPVAVSNLPIKPGSFVRGAVENPINAAAGVDWMTESRQGGEGSDRPDERE